MNGLGPHYYLPGIALTVVLIAHGMVSVLSAMPRSRRVAAGASIVVLGFSATVFNSIDKVEDIQHTREFHERAANAVLPAGRALVLPSEQRYVLSQHPYLSNDPKFREPVQFAVDDGFVNLEARAVVEGRSYRLQNVWYPGDELFAPTVEYTPLSYVTGSLVCIQLSDPTAGSLYEGWLGQRRLIGRELEVLAGSSGSLELFLEPADPDADRSRTRLRYDTRDDGFLEVEVPSSVEVGIAFPEMTAWLTSRDPRLMPLRIFEGRCP